MELENNFQYDWLIIIIDKARYGVWPLDSIIYWINQPLSMSTKED